MSVEPLSEREAHALEHLHRARELEVSVAEYARSFNLDAKDLYSAKQTLVRKGVLPGRSSEEDEAEEAQRSDFVPVTVSMSHAPILGDTMCRIRHPSGLVIECAGFPPAAWVIALLTGVRSVSAGP